MIHISNNTFKNFLAFSRAGTTYVKNDGIAHLKWWNVSLIFGEWTKYKYKGTWTYT